MARRALVTLTTDFGTRDPYVGQMRGVLLTICPWATVVDLTHDVPPGDLRAAGYALAAGIGAFPEGAVHLAVVDPGVGTARRRIAARVDGRTFVAPDNGLLTPILHRGGSRVVWSIEQGHFRRAEPSATFEGRDVFAPAAAWLARGAEPDHLGPRIDDPVLLPEDAGREAARVVWIDRFGNAALSLDREALSDLTDGATGRFTGVVEAGGTILSSFRTTFADGPRGEPFLLWNSAGHLEIAERDASAAARLGLAVGDTVRVRPGVL